MLLNLLCTGNVGISSRIVLAGRKSKLFLFFQKDSFLQVGSRVEYKVGVRAFTSIGMTWVGYDGRGRFRGMQLITCAYSANSS